MGKSMWVMFMAVGALIVVSPTADSASKMESGSKMKCPHPGASETCEANAETCYYKFTLTKVEDAQNVEARYTEGVYSETKKEMKDDKEKDRVKELRKKKFSIKLKPNQSVEPKKDQSYLMTRCPDNEYEIVKQISEQDKD